ncbi:hypothetical protein ACIQMZ_37200 [Streptomyces longwoodensis]|uniref:hypothetical protein n=1 Tax=Streptomyces longwoodensis TaxID=68231 RepID=UPI00380138FE
MIAYLLIGFDLIGAAVLIVMSVRMRRQTRDFNATVAMFRRVQASQTRDLEFALWARHTMFNVTREDGTIEYGTFWDTWEQKRGDRIWNRPIAVSMWTGTPDVVRQFRRELEQEEGDTGG